MLTHNKLAIIGAMGLFLAVFSAEANASPQPTPAVDETAVIYVTGSKNTRPFTVVVFSQGGACFNEHGRGLPLPLAHKLFNQLKASSPLAGLPVRHGKKSTSFGTSTYIMFRGEQTPDLTFPANNQEKALKADVAAIIAGLN